MKPTPVKTAIALLALAAALAGCDARAQAQGLKPGAGSGSLKPPGGASLKPRGASPLGLDSPAVSAQPSVKAPAVRPGPTAAASTAPAASAAPAAPAGQRYAEYIVALVNSEPVTNTDVQKRIERVLAQGNPEAEKLSRPELAQMVLERLILERIQLQQAKELGVKVDDLAIDQAEEVVAQQNQVSVAQLRRKVADQGLTQAQFRKELSDQLTFQKLRAREVESGIKVSDLEVDQFLNQQFGNKRPKAAAAAAAAPPAASAGSGQIDLAQLLVAVPESATSDEVAKLKQRADALAARARSGEDFGKLVADNSDARGAAAASIGLASPDRYPSLFVEATAKTPVGGIAGPVRSGAGFHVIKVVERGKPGSASASAAKGNGGGDAVVEQTQLRHILLRNDPKRSTDDLVRQLAEYKRRIESAGADFATLAREHSQDSSAKEGGELGWHQAGDFVPEFEAAVERLKPGQISDPIVSRFGVHLIQVEDRRQAKLDGDELREAARTQLRQKKIEEAFETWLQELRARAYVEMREPPS